MEEVQSAEPRRPVAIPPAVDVRKMLEQVKVPGLDIKSLMEETRKDIDALSAVNDRAYLALEFMALRQAEVLNAALSEWQSSVKDLFTSKGIADGVAHEVAHVRTSLECALREMRTIAYIVAESHEEAAEIIARRIRERLGESLALPKPPS
jgi:phasin family protein